MLTAALVLALLVVLIATEPDYKDFSPPVADVQPEKSSPPPLSAEKRLPRFAALILLMLVILLLSTGCVSSKYQASSSDTAAPTLDVPFSPAPLAATLNTVIAYNGPGSWKNDACWDEYIVRITNHSAAPLQVESATLTDFQGAATSPGADPWLLEKSSVARQKELSRTTRNVLVQVGAGYTTVGVVGSALAATGGFAAGALVLPAYIGGAVYRNHTHRKKIEAEFAHRRLVLPATLAPGQTVQGSLFFRLAPGPRSLVLAYQDDHQAGTTTANLTPLAGLHLRDQATVAAVTRADP